ncbi:hypothetical protein B0T17DRAFT_39117 [Bombardia bombarda]|uniref:Uncharacterized protein n=1 Tax=Bombardia bombarda TaxID=252184 RepID=A0AA40CEC3_9PEZI|nr:hypothetical protein B0T17DRAFT_39117 [Bombardia bombarda]
MSDAQNPPRTSTQRPVAAEAQAQARARAQSNGVGNAHDNNNDNGGSRSSSVTTASGNDHGNGGAAGYKSPYQPVSQPQFHSQLPPHLRMQTQAQHPQAQHPQAQHPQAQHPQAQAQSQSPTQSQSQSQSQTSTHAQAQFRAIHARNQRLQQTTYMPGTFRPLASRPPPVMVPPPPQTGQIAKRQAEPENHQHQHHQAPPPDPAPAAKRQRTTQQDARHPPSVPGPYVPGAPYVPRDMSKLPDLPHHFVQQPDMSKLPELPPHFILQPDICKPDSSSSSTSTSNQPGKFSYDMKIITLTSIVHLETWTQQVEAMARACGCFRELTTRFGNFPRPGTVEAFICQTRFMASWRILAESISGHVWAYMRVLGFSLIPVFKGADGVLWQPAPVDVFYYAREAGARLLMPGSREQSRLEVRRMVEELRTGRPDDYPSERHHKKGHKWLKSILDNLIRNGDGAVCEALYDVKPDWAPAQWRRPPVAVLGREGGWRWRSGRGRGCRGIRCRGEVIGARRCRSRVRLSGA